MAKEIVLAHPTKTLFIDILTQDLDVKDCIMDLIDNSIDSYNRHRFKNKKQIKLTINNNSFEIYDNCGGIEKQLLKEKAFLFGVEELKGVTKSIGLYGIGMKRAIFKIGKKVELESDDGNYRNLLKIDVNKWRVQSDWNFEIDSTKSKATDKKEFTRIRVTDLREEIRIKFDSTSFLENLKKGIHVMYTVFMQKNVDIFLNKEKITPLDIEVTFDKNYQPARHHETYLKVDIDIVCFVEPTKGRTTKEIGKTGWNIFINDRLILVDDTSEITGWTGERGNLPKYHSIYNQFRGLVFLKSDDVSILPLNTFKNSLNIESKTYNYVLKKMVNTARPIINYLTKKYEKEKTETENIEDNISSSSESVSKTKLSDLPVGNFNFKAPEKSSQTFTTISFSKPKEIVEKVKRHLQVRNNNEVGLKTFDYYVKTEEIK